MWFDRGRGVRRGRVQPRRGEGFLEGEGHLATASLQRRFKAQGGKGLPTPKPRATASAAQVSLSNRSDGAS